MDLLLPQFISISGSNSLNVLSLRSLRPHLPGPSVIDRPIYIISTSNSDSWGSEPSKPSSSATVLSPESASGKQPVNEIVELLSDEEDSRVPASEDTTGYEREAQRLVGMGICDKQRALSVLAEVNGDLQRAATLILDALTAMAGV